MVGTGSQVQLSGLGFRWTPHPVIVGKRGNKDYIRVLLYS